MNFDPNREICGYLIRHGTLTSMSVWDSWTGMELNEEGRQQAEKSAQWLSFEKIGRVISSDLPRTMETAQYLMDTGCVVCPFLSCDPNLRPWNVGDEFTGKEKTFARLDSFKKYVTDPSLVIPGGESRNQMNLRVQVIFQYLATPYDAKPTAIFIHNSVMKSLMGIDDVKDAVDPGGIIQVTLDEKGEMFFDVVLGECSVEKGVS
jgi:broad specificity phosphatase PhoE